MKKKKKKQVLFLKKMRLTKVNFQTQKTLSSLKKITRLSCSHNSELVGTADFQELTSPAGFVGKHERTCNVIGHSMTYIPVEGKLHSSLLYKNSPLVHPF